MRPLVLVLACSCSGAPAASPGGGHVADTGDRCAAVRGKVEQLYRAEARQREPAHVDEAVADNTAMVMADCAREPARIAPCIAAASAVADLEARCLIPIDDEGTEGDRAAH